MKENILLYAQKLRVDFTHYYCIHKAGYSLDRIALTEIELCIIELALINNRPISQEEKYWLGRSGRVLEDILEGTDLKGMIHTYYHLLDLVKECDYLKF